MTVMTLNAQRLDAEIGDLVAIEGQYDVVSDKQGGVCLSRRSRLPSRRCSPRRG